jgi:hypothetical protein
MAEVTKADAAAYVAAVDALAAQLRAEGKAAVEIMLERNSAEVRAALDLCASTGRRLPAATGSTKLDACRHILLAADGRAEEARCYRDGRYTLSDG